MIIINYNCNNPLEWTVFKGLSKDVEDFTRSKVMLFAISETNKIPLAIESKDDGCIKATIPAGFEIPTGLTALTYDTELIWIKNGRDVNRTYQYNVFKVDTSSTALKQTIRIKSTALVYGYDGLSAYEIAMMKAENPISENEWLRNLLAEKANTTDLNALRYRVDDIEDTLSEFEEDISNLEDSVSNLDDSKADKDYVDNLLHQTFDSKADKVDTYTKSEVDSALGLKANADALESAETNILSLLSEMRLAKTAIGTIEDEIPSLATKEFVNSSISTNTATFRGTYNQKTSAIDCAPDADPTHVAERIPLVVLVADNNDYVFVLVPINQSPYDIIERVDRYKYVVDQNNEHWEFEYTLNNSGFTAEQWAALNSGITNNHVQKVNGLDAALAAKLDILTFDSTPTANSFNPVTSNGLYIALLNILSTSGGTINGTLTMNGNIDMLMDALHSWNSIKTTTGRNLFCFNNGFNGYMIGDENIKVGILTGSNNDVPTPIYHRITVNGTDVDHPILDTYNLPANVKTINNTSVAGAGNIDINDAFKVVYGVTPIEDIVDAYNDGKYIYAVILDQDENADTGSIYVLYAAHIDINTTNTYFGFSQYYGDGSDISWFELTSDGYSEIYYSTTVTTGDLTAALSDYTTTSDLTTLLNNKQNTVDSSHKLSADVIDDSSATNKFVTSSDKTLWNTVTEKAPLPFVVTVSISPAGDVTSISHTISEINAAYSANKQLRLKCTNVQQSVWFEEDLTGISQGGGSYVYVSHTVTDEGTHYIVTIYDDSGTTKARFETVDDKAYAKYNDMLINSITPTIAASTVTIDGYTLHPSEETFVVKPYQKIAFSDTNSDCQLYIIDATSPSAKTVISQKSHLITWDNQSDTDITIQVGINNSIPGTLNVSTYWRGIDNVFIAEYNVTSISEIQSAVDSGRVVMCRAIESGNIVYYQLSQSSSESFTFFRFVGARYYRITLNKSTGVWSTSDDYLQSTSNRDSSIDSSASTTHYPSTKAVYDYVDNIVGNINSILETI